jgi:hypothetical protein
MSCKIYDSKEVSVIFAGILIDSGFAEDTFVAIEQASDDFETVVGCDGEVTRSKTNDHRATVTVTLMQSSTLNTALSVLNNIDRKAKNGAGVGPLLIKDRNGTSLYAASKAWVKRPPNAEFGKTAKERAWMIECADLERLDGGN